LFQDSCLYSSVSSITNVGLEDTFASLHFYCTFEGVEKFLLSGVCLAAASEMM